MMKKEEKLQKENAVREKIRNYKKGDVEWYKEKNNHIVTKTFAPVSVETIKEVLKNSKKLPYADVDQSCEYHHRDERKGKREELKQILKDENKIDEYIVDKKSGTPKPRMEERMCHVLFAQGLVGDFEVVDYQIPTTNGGEDKIDLLLKKGDEFYMTEVKKFSKTCQKFKKGLSDETMIRCVLEIQTYYQKLNKNFFDVYEIKDKSKLKKAVLIDEGTEAYKAYKVRKEKWARDIVEFFDITPLELYRDGAEFKIRDIKI